MCTDAFNAETGEKISSIGGLKAVCRGEIYFRDDEQSPSSDNTCLCPVDVASSLVYAGYRVWLGDNGSILFDSQERVM